MNRAVAREGVVGGEDQGAKTRFVEGAAGAGEIGSPGHGLAVRVDLVGDIAGVNELA